MVIFMHNNRTSIELFLRRTLVLLAGKPAKTAEEYILPVKKQITDNKKRLVLNATMIIEPGDSLVAFSQYSLGVLSNRAHINDGTTKISR